MFDVSGKPPEEKFNALVANFDDHSAEYQDNSIDILDHMQSECSGGLDTTQSLGMISVHLGRNPDRRQELIDNRGIMDGAIEEFLHVFPPMQGDSRRADKDAVVAGQANWAEERMFMSCAVASRDPDKFENPQETDFRRENNRHLLFDMGPHRCSGSHLARLEAKVPLGVLLTRAPNYELGEECAELATDIGTVAGYEHVEVKL